ncbi:cytochrome ubiquinol oxidase subunit I [Pseudomonas putida]
MESVEWGLMAARTQFAVTISFHIVLAAFSTGLANFLLVLEALWLRRREQVYLDIYRYWLKIFALSVAIGTASSLMLEYQFGLNWARLSSQAGEILGPLMFYEVMAPAGFMAMISGWVVTEVGRQLFTVYGLLRTADGASPASKEQVVGSTLVILIFYLVVFGIGLWVLLRILRHPAKTGEQEPQPTLPDEIGRP